MNGATTMRQSTIEISIIQNTYIHYLSLTHTVTYMYTMQNWIRNRRRPTAVKSAEKFVEKISQGNLPPVPTIPNIPSLPTNMTSMGLSTPSTLSSDSLVVTSSAQPSTSNLSNLSRTLATHLLPEPKRVCTDSGRCCLCKGREVP